MVPPHLGRGDRLALSCVAAIAFVCAPALAQPEGATVEAAPTQPAPAGELASGGGAEPPIWYKLRAPYDDPAFKAGPVPPARKNYLVPVGEVLLIDGAVWAFDYLTGKPYAKISWDSIHQNFKKGWIVDSDDFWANQLAHPYHGAFNYMTARSMGLSLYESYFYALFGSYVWEQFAEIQPPSMNDLVNTSLGGAMLGEALYRMHRLILDSGGYDPSVVRQIFAFIVSPVAGFNYLAFGNKYRGSLLLPPSWIGQFRFGGVILGSSRDGRNSSRSWNVGPWLSVSADVIYGVPGTPGLELKRPFDHFELTGSGSFTETEHPTLSLLINGVLVGETFEAKRDSGGLWGLFTSYDFIAPVVFRASGFGFGPGVILMRRWDWFALFGTAIAEFLPWAGGGSMQPLGVRDYHYGLGAKGTLELRAHFSDRAIVRLLGRQFWINGTYASGQSENISYGKLSTAVRIEGVHGASVELDWGYRRAKYPNTPDIWQRGSALALYYTLFQGW